MLYQGFEPLLVDDLWGIRTHDPFPVKEVLSHWANKSYVIKLNRAWFKTYLVADFFSEQDLLYSGIQNKTSSFAKKVFFRKVWS